MAFLEGWKQSTNYYWEELFHGGGGYKLIILPQTHHAKGVFRLCHAFSYYPKAYSTCVWKSSLDLGLQGSMATKWDSLSKASHQMVISYLTTKT